MFSMYCEDLYKSRIETNDVTVVAEYGDHDHSDEVSNVAAVALRVSCTRTVSKVLLVFLARSRAYATMSVSVCLSVCL